MKKTKMLFIIFMITAMITLFTRSNYAYFSDGGEGSGSSIIHSDSIGLSLLENGEIIAISGEGEQTAGLLEGVELLPGPIYQENIEMENTGGIDEYCRIIMYKYWIDAEGNKVTSADSNLIKVTFANTNDLIFDESSATDERTVAYYKNILTVGEEVSIISSIQIDSSINDIYEIEENTQSGYTSVSVARKYDGLKACIEVEVDGIQGHNAEDVALSAWGVNITIMDDVITEVN